MRVILDANIIVSLLLTRGETIASIFDSWDGKKFDLLTSEKILEEITAVLGYEKIKTLIDPVERDALLEKVKLQAELVEATAELDVVRDPRDNKYLECALDGNADFVVSGDKHLLALKRYGTIEILTPREFVRTLKG
ncbi:putative toxin-antitoxin system toxin component, PIN family [Candidatus Parcubacteria bacterium]|nr:putative toxin-antitoxin system toxin component, PIN family [Candidatus Parcubacteria bacterium]